MCFQILSRFWKNFEIISKKIRAFNYPNFKFCSCIQKVFEAKKKAKIRMLLCSSHCSKLNRYSRSQNATVLHWYIGRLNIECPCGRGAIGHSEDPIGASTNRFCPISMGRSYIWLTRICSRALTIWHFCCGQTNYVNTFFSNQYLFGISEYLSKSNFFRTYKHFQKIMQF